MPIKYIVKSAVKCKSFIGQYRRAIGIGDRSSATAIDIGDRRAIGIGDRSRAIGIGDRSRKGSIRTRDNDVHRDKGDAEVIVDEIAGREVHAADESEPVGAPGTRGRTPCSWVPRTALELTDDAQVDGLAVLPLLGFLGVIM